MSELFQLLEAFPTNPFSKSVPLHKFYEEAENVSSILEVISLAQSVFGMTNIKQRAVIHLEYWI